MNFQRRSKTIYGMDKQSEISYLEQKEIPIYLKEMEKIK